MTKPFFGDSVDLVGAWLSSMFGSHIQLAQRQPACVKGWRIRLGAEAAPVEWVEVQLPVDFPNSAPRVRIDPRLVLVFPHVEANGFLCLGSQTTPEALRLDPTAAVHWALSRFHDAFLDLALAPPVADPFESEALSYWAIFTGRYYKAARFKCLMPVDVPPSGFVWRACNGIGVGDARAYYSADVDQVERYYRQFLGAGTRRRLEAIELSIAGPLTPRNWPTDFRSLRAMVEAISTEACDRLEKIAGTRSGRRKAGQAIAAVVFRSSGVAQGYLVQDRATVPVSVERADRTWALGRDSSPRLAYRAGKHALILGLGSLGSAVLELLARSGIGRLTLVDPDLLEMGNLGRHLLTAQSLGRFKVSDLAARVRDVCPDTVVDAHRVDAALWLSKQDGLARFDVIVDLTGEMRVRRLFNTYRLRQHASAPWVIGWLEPYCAAGHAVVVTAGIDWALDGEDPAGPRINAAHWPESAFTRLSGCGASFQSYTAASMSYVAAMVADAILDAVDGAILEPEVRSWTKRLSYYRQHCPTAVIHPWRRSLGDDADRIVVRSWSAL